METIIFALVLVLIAGIINGSFATPMKYMSKWEEENIWLTFSLWGFLILPWISISFMVPDVFKIISSIPNSLLWTMILGGIGFGIGQIAFALAFKYVGIGLAFVINISMGTAGSALIPLLWHKGLIGTSYSYVQLLGIIVFIIAVCFGAAAGSARDKSKGSAHQELDSPNVKHIKPGMLLLGVFLAIIAGVGSVAQGTTYIWANPTVSEIATSKFGATELGASIIAWVIIFSAAWIPYAAYFFILNIKRKSFTNFTNPKSFKYLLLTIFMGVGFWGSLIFFSRASNEIGGTLAPTIAWPLFMVFIIFTSNFWSWKSGEWKNAGRVAIKRMGVSLLFLTVAIITFSFSSSLQPKAAEDTHIKHHQIHYMFIKHQKYPRHTHKKPVEETKNIEDNQVEEKSK